MSADNVRINCTSSRFFAAPCWCAYRVVEARTRFAATTLRVRVPEVYLLPQRTSYGS